MGTGGSGRHKGAKDAPVEGRGNVGDQPQKFGREGEPVGLMKVFIKKIPTEKKFEKSVQ